MYRKDLWIYACIAALAILILKVSEFSFLIRRISLEIYMGFASLVFVLLGIYIGYRFLSNQKTRRRKMNISSQDFVGLSKRELEVLKLMAEGLSNKEIAEQLFVSIPTVKSHLSKSYEKLEVRGRTQAVQRCMDIGILQHNTKV